MRRKLLATATGVAGAMLAFAWPAGASGDYGCQPSWKLDKPDLDCGSSIVLSPGNDTRVNLSLLLRDRAGLAPRSGSYPDLDWDYGYARNFFSWSLFAQAVYPVQEWPDNEYYGSRCISLQGGDAAFSAAVAASTGLSAGERDTLITARSQLAPICASFGRAYWLIDKDDLSQPALDWPANVASRQGKELLNYLIATAAFYGEDWAVARSTYASLTSASNAWVSETARYMLARVDLNAAQASSFDEWGFYSGPESVDQEAAQRASLALADYLKRFPSGSYSASARGLERRALWLKGDLKGLAAIYERMALATTPGSAFEGDLVEEIDNKLLLANGAAQAIDTPLLLATYNLMRMRAGNVEHYEFGPRPIERAELAAQKPIFEGRDDLYDFLLATYDFYVAGDAGSILQRIPDTSSASGHSALEFSRQVLRGQALAAQNDPGEEAFWKRMIAGAQGLYQRPTAELGLALHWERSGKLGQVFADNSPVEDSMIRMILLEQVAGPEILRAQAKNAGRPLSERELALFTLLYKQLTRGMYSSFISDLALLPSDADSEGGLWQLRANERMPLGLFVKSRSSEGYACPLLAETVSTLARNPRDVKGRLCLGDFYRLNGFDGFYDYAIQPNADELGGTPELFPGEETARSSFYTSIISDPAASRADKAYALYRAVMCYAPSGNNTCGGEAVALEQRRAWFNALKRQYADSRWAKELRYYW